MGEQRPGPFAGNQVAHRGPDGPGSPAAASSSVMLVPLPPKSHSAITPRVGSPGVRCSAMAAAVASGISRTAAQGPLPARHAAPLATSTSRCASAGWPHRRTCGPSPGQPGQRPGALGQHPLAEVTGPDRRPGCPPGRPPGRAKSASAVYAVACGAVGLPLLRCPDDGQLLLRQRQHRCSHHRGIRSHSGHTGGADGQSDRLHRFACHLIPSGPTPASAPRRPGLGFSVPARSVFRQHISGWCLPRGSAAGPGRSPSRAVDR